ncbi:unnamed protein product [Orchesella dallaii]|uniref:Uncharacterized protein n=1 Tax=Orchesella dallaii TaxID=48710 RepID=A0ABP1RB56_9HEXA
MGSNGSLRFLCSVCPTQKLPLLPTSVKVAEDVTSYWKIFHRDLMGMHVNRVGEPIKTFCEVRILGPGPSGDCILQMMREKLNVSIPSTNSRTPTAIDLMSSVILSQGIILNLVHKKHISIFRRNIPASGVTVMEYAFMIVTSRVAVTLHNDMGALIQPFQQSVWFAIIFSAIIMPIALTLSQMKTLRKITVKAYWEWTFLSFSVLIDQCSDSLHRLFTSYQASYLWLIWNFFCIIITNCYDGELYSFLAANSPPPTPNTLREIAFSNLPILTFATGIKLLENGTVGSFSQLHSLLQPNKIQNGVAQDQTQIPLPVYYKMLTDKVTFFSMAGKNSFDLKDSLITMHVDKNSKGFAFVDTMDHIQIFGPVVDLSGKRKVVKRRPINNFGIKKIWLVRKFYVANKFENILWQTMESGLKDYWDKNNLRSIQLGAVKSPKGMRNGTKLRLPSFSLINYLLCTFEMDRVAMNDERVVPIPLGLMYSVLKLFAILMLVGMICLVVENIVIRGFR